jgi:hypothetical protein
MKKTLLVILFTVSSRFLMAQFNSLIINKLNINAGSEANYTPNSGFLLLGNINDRNLVFDNNEILARTNGLPFDLRLQSQGGKVGIGEPFPTSKLHVNNGTTADLSSNSGFLQIGPLNAANLLFDGSQILSRFNGVNSTLFLQKDGRLSIGGNGPTAAKVNIRGGNDASLANGTGYLVNGEYSGQNMVFDDNEIMVRNNGVAANLFLQNGSGNLGIGSGSADAKVQIFGGDNVSLANNTGDLMLGGYFGRNLAMDGDEIQARNNGVAANLILQKSGGNIGINSLIPNSKLHIEGGSDATLVNGSGYLTTGSAIGPNLVIDDNEILARNNGVASNLFLQNSTGRLGIGTNGWAHAKVNIWSGIDISLANNTGDLLMGHYDQENLVLDANEIQARNNGLASNITLQKLGGDVGIGTQLPNSKLHIDGGTNATLAAGSGYLTTGSANGFNLVIDNNEIMARNNGLAANLIIQNVVGGNVGIGSVNPMQKLHVVGNICYTGTIGACSDFRYKKDFSAIDNPLNNVLKMNGLHYYWKTEEFKDHDFTTSRQIGFIAQEVEKIFPELVLTDANGYKSVDYSRLTPILVEAMKEQNQQIESLKKENTSLKASIEERLGKMESLLMSKKQSF